MISCRVSLALSFTHAANNCPNCMLKIKCGGGAPCKLQLLEGPTVFQYTTGHTQYFRHHSFEHQKREQSSFEHQK